MPSPSASRSLLVLAALLTISLLAFAGCGDDDDDNPVDPGGNTPATQLTGTFMGPNEGGLMNLTIPLAQASLATRLRSGSTQTHSVTAIATLSPDVGGTANLIGSYNEETDSLYLSGEGYTMTGHYDPAEPVPGIIGPYTGPNGAGFFGCAVGGSGTVKVYCGMYVNYLQTATGRLNLATIGDDVRGLVVVGDEVHNFEGTSTATANARTITINQDLGGGEVLIADGTINLTTGDVSGDWRIEVDSVVWDFGSWDGSTCLTGGTN